MNKLIISEQLNHLQSNYVAKCGTSFSLWQKFWN